MKRSKGLMIIGSLLLLGLFVFPLWNISLEAPQYPDGIGMNIYITKIGDANPNDIKNINLMNHYVGMDPIPTDMTEFKVFPAVILIMVVLGLLIGFKANYKWYLAWFIVMLLLGTAGIYDFYLWEYVYGHNLNAKAAIKFTNPDGSLLAYQPPLFGTKHILNFTAHSYPRLGAFTLFIGMGLTLLAYIKGKKEANA